MDICKTCLYSSHQGHRDHLHTREATSCAVKCFAKLVQITEREFQELFPGQVVRVGMVHDTSDLDPLVSEYNQLKRKLEDLLDDYLGRQKRLLKIKRRKVAQPECQLHTT